jgi:cytosine/uracil/thiamine/allantoin permease
MTEQEAVPAGYSDRLYNEDLAPAKERRWGSYSIFALWMERRAQSGELHVRGWVVRDRTSGAVQVRPLHWL